MLTSSLILVIFILSQNSASAFPILNNGDCALSQNDYRKTNDSCVGNRGRFLVRSMNCEEGGFRVDICCRKPVRADIQASRNRWFHAVAFVGEKISVSCTKRILCLQACLDTLYKQPRADYPEALESDSPETEEFVQAFMRGKAVSYCNPNFRAPGRIVFRVIVSRFHPYAQETCNQECEQMFPECARDMETSALAYVFFRLSSIFHNSGMWSFGVAMKARDIFNEFQALSA